MAMAPSAPKKTSVTREPVQRNRVPKVRAGLRTKIVERTNCTKQSTNRS